MSQYGLKDIHFALLETDDKSGVSYGVVEEIIGAINAKINPNVNTQELYADDQLWEAISALGKIEVDSFFSSTRRMSINRLAANKGAGDFIALPRKGGNNLLRQIGIVVRVLMIIRLKLQNSDTFLHNPNVLLVNIYHLSVWRSICRIRAFQV